MPWNAVRCAGLELATSGSMLVTSVVPPGVPSVRQSSMPVAASSAENRIEPRWTKKPDGDEPFAPAMMSLTSVVPAAVPSLRHSSVPAWLSSAVKSTKLPYANSDAGGNRRSDGGS
jgi:hypothetical protein